MDTIKKLSTAAALAAMLSGAAWGSNSVTRTSSFAYDSASGLPVQEVVEPDTPALRLQTDYTYDGFGNKVLITASGVDIATRSSASNFDTKGQFNIGNTNALGQSESVQYDARFGTPTSQTGPNGLTTTWSYDTFGRKIGEVRPDGTQTKWSYRFCNGDQIGAGCPSSATYLIAEIPLNAAGTAANGPLVIAYFDQLDRDVGYDSQGLDGSITRVTKVYDALGRVSQISRPYFFSGGTPQYTTFTYDVLGRVLTKTRPDGGVSQVAYHGLTITKTNALGKARSITKNSQGNIVSVTDALGQTMTYGYDAFGNLTKAIDASGNVTTATYDVRGTKVVDADPDMGSWSYTYNTLGLPVSQTDAKGQTLSLIYDKLDRVIQRIEPDKTSIWTYDTAAHGLGKLASTGITAGTGAGYARSVTYDTLSRPNQIATVIDGTTYTMTATYDSNGLISKVGYPSGFTARYAYTSLGDVNQLLDDATSQVQWTANAMDAELHLTQQTSGNGLVTTKSFDALTGRLTSVATGSGATVQSLSVTYDKRGNPLSRNDANTSLSEAFTYDALNRLISSTVNLTPTPLAKTFSYDSIGNLLSKSDVGTYAYAAAGQPQPHAVTSIGAGSISTTFSYDLNGNQTSGLGRTIAWTSYNKPSSITQGTRTISFVDDTEHQRFKQVTPEGTKLYLSAFGVSAEVTNPGTSSQIWTDYLSVGQVMAGMRTIQTASETVTTRYFHTDHLGSISVITNEAGAVVERLGYDAWGKRRNPGGTDDSTGSITSQSSRGFTGEEQLSVASLIHLNGRVYDSVIGRMTSADPTVPRPLSTQGWNRYAYVGNGPLRYIDPTGYKYCATDPGGDEASGTDCDPNEPPTGTGTGTGTGPGPTIDLPPVTVDAPQPRDVSVSYCTGCSSGISGGDGGSGPIVIDLLGSSGGGGSNLDGTWNWNSPALNYFYGYYGGAPGLSATDIMHGSLTAASFAPSTAGSVASAANGLLYLTERDWTNGGINIAAAVLGLGSDAGLVRLGLSGAKEVNYLYRGVHAGHPAFEAARAGRAVPGNIRGTVTAAEHNGDLTGATIARSPFTSWTREIKIAEDHAGKDGLILRVETGPPPAGAKWSWEWSPDVYNEGEVLLRGVRENCGVLQCGR